jgi:hypothetical protein
MNEWGYKNNGLMTLKVYLVSIYKKKNTLSSCFKLLNFYDLVCWVVNTVIKFNLGQPEVDLAKELGLGSH